MSRIAYPFLRVSEKVLELGEWHYTAGGETEAVPADGIPGWDYHLDLQLIRTYSIDVEQAVESVGLVRGEASIELLVTCETGPGGLRWIGFRAPLLEALAKGEIRVDIGSRSLASRIDVRTELVLSGAPIVARALAPSRPGSRLFEERRVIPLEGKLSRFPTQPLDFATGLPGRRIPDALWHLQWLPGGLDSQVSAAMTLLVNERHGGLATRLNSDPVLQGVLKVDIARGLLRRALAVPEFAEDIDSFEEGTVGRSAAGVFRVAFPDSGVDEVKRLLEQDPDLFDATVQSALLRTLSGTWNG